MDPSKLLQALFDTARYLLRELRKALFTADRPDGTYLAVDAPLREIEAALGRQSYAPNWEFSYHERGEVLNLARIEYEERTVHGREHRWWQTHVRGWEAADGRLELHGHWELEPTENGSEHLDGVGFSMQRGQDNLRADLDESGLGYEERTLST